MVVLAIVVIASLTWSHAQTTNPAPVQTSPIFTGGRATATQAFRNFFGIRPEPVQPIAYTHTVHIHKAGLQCNYCHVGVDKGPIASIPNVPKCMECHEFTIPNNPEIQKIAAYQKRGEEIPWQRVYGWVDDSHVKFNHAPHIRANVECATCHGDVANMTTAKKVVNHTMGFCISCHEQKKASNDCMTCHY
jgi:hypothetical protein